MTPSRGAARRGRPLGRALVTAVLAAAVMVLVGWATVSDVPRPDLSRAGALLVPTPAPRAAAPAATLVCSATGSGATTRHDLERQVATLAPDAVSVAAWDTDTGARVRCGAAAGLTTASVIKLDVLETLLLEHQDTGTALSAPENAQATTMIENSDDDAATALWAGVGGERAITAANRRLGTTHLAPDPDDFWGLSTTSADDQLALLHDLTGPGPLDPDSRRFALTLMRGVERDQTWGVGGVADPGTSPAVKNGWLDVDHDAGRWAVGSVGVTTLRGQQVLVAALTQHDVDEPSGIVTVDQLARAAADSVVAG